MNEPLLFQWSFARQTLGLCEAEFWARAPAELAELRARWSEEQERQDRRTATLCMVLGNCHLPRGAPPFSIDDFMPKPAVPPGEQPWDEQKAVFAQIAAAHSAA